MSYLANAGVTVAELESNFSTVADIVLSYINGGAAKSGDAGVPDSGSEETTGSNYDDIEF
jgi:hypothetical protein